LISSALYYSTITSSYPSLSKNLISEDNCSSSELESSSSSQSSAVSTSAALSGSLVGFAVRDYSKYEQNRPIMSPRPNIISSIFGQVIINNNVEIHFKTLQRLLLHSRMWLHVLGPQRGTPAVVNHETLGPREVALGDKLDLT
jgi:hypothetical protein